MQQHGFSLLSEQQVKEIAGLARLWRHEATGAQLLSVLAPDENKVFSANFRTPPRDSTGVAHILEHSVLCGSTRFPVKEPFVELIKGSLNTFLNAFTYPDKTCYPVASCNLQDLRNLTAVYLDAVFHPLIPETVFRQEGWHYEAEAGRLSRKGVVYNEMKGAYSSPDSVLSELSQQILFPDTVYGLDSGGHPERIPELTFAAFRDFHARYYHPSNCRFYCYGDDPEEGRLAMLAEALRGYSAQPVDSGVKLQASFAAPRRRVEPYAAGKGAGGMCTLGWLLPDTSARELVLCLEMLEHILIGLPSSPLRRALIESGLGEDLAGAGLENELRQMYFSIGLKGLDSTRVEEDAEAVEELILDTLGRLAREGVSAEAVEAALNSVEFDLRENNTGSFPRGLSLMLRALTVWLHDGDPLAALGFEAELSAIKARIAAGEPLFERLMESLLLENPHRAFLVLVPDQELSARREAAERQALDQVAQGLGAAGLERVAAEARELARLQSTPDDPSDLAAIPRLTLADLRREEAPIPCREAPAALGATLLAHELPSAGICYLDLGLDLSVVPEELLYLVPLFGRALTEMGAGGLDFEALDLWIARRTGGLEAEPFCSTALGPDGAPSGRAAARLFVRGKAVADNTSEMLDILRAVLFSPKLADQERFAQMVLEEKARLEQRLAPAGHRVVMTRLRAGYGPAGLANERMHGVSALFAVRGLAARVEQDWPGVLADLERLHQLLVSRKNLAVGLTADGASLAQCEGPLVRFLEELPAPGAPAQEWKPAPAPAWEGLAMPVQVHYVGQALDLRAVGYAFSGAALALTNLARTGRLWERVRVQGGAYGAFCGLERASGLFTFASYRDPNLAKTLDAYASVAEFLRAGEVSPVELEKSVIGAMGDLDAHLLPDAKGFASLVRRLTGDTLDLRQRMRDELLSCSRATALALADALDAARPSARVCALGGRESLEASGLPFQITELMG
jgi:presequence protease